MKVPTFKVPGLRRRKGDDLPGLTATARIDRRTKRLTKRLKAGEIAIIDHVDIDRVSAEALVACGAAAVINVANLGPKILLEAGVPLIDNASPELFERVRDGDVVRLLNSLTGWALERGVELDGLEVTRPTLEEVYLRLVGEEGRA